MTEPIFEPSRYRIIWVAPLQIRSPDLGDLHQNRCLCPGTYALPT